MSAAERMSVAYLMTRLPVELVARAYGLPVRYIERVAAKTSREVGSGPNASRLSKHVNGGNRDEKHR